MEKLGYGKGYKYAHDFPDHVVEQEHLPKELEANNVLFSVGLRRREAN